MKVLILGSGIAGLCAAIRLAEGGARVELVSPYISERSQSVMAAGGINASDNVSLHAEDTFRAGCGIESRKAIAAKLQEPYFFCRLYPGIDITKEDIPVTPTVHFFMGGLRVDDRHRTDIKNIYAIGECAAKYHVANRLGGNSLLAAI